ncbi:Uu.00g090280.m01.CDS01 [Anthostomella pinea]|uniref:Uu.00g090280.m01.CDS01 n=1 Tax=Anthostomella pinea TaxID=933095 RepID=A0AAI8VNJ2_9PEZI|nr:Uu.00g090280.m01.CDS01 [Anthostomella pinea]
MDKLYDLSGTVIAVCVIFIAVCTTLTFLRLWVRWQKGSVGADDYLFLCGLMLWLTSTSFLFPACWNGLGAHQHHYTDEQATQAMKYFFLFQDFYTWSNIPIKMSLCLTLRRLASTSPWITWTLYGIMFVTFGASVGTNIYLLTDCTPLAATWDTTIPGAHCRPPANITTLGYAYSAINIAVDWVIALLPVFFLWRLQMAWRQKLTVMIVLALGIFASCATVVRLFTLEAFSNKEDYLFGIAHIVFWTVIEMGLAIIAGSLATLRPLFRSWFGGSTLRPSQGGDFGPRTRSGPGAYNNKTNGNGLGYYHDAISQDSRIGLKTMINYDGSREHEPTPEPEGRGRSPPLGAKRSGSIKVTRSLRVRESILIAD